MCWCSGEPVPEVTVRKDGTPVEADESGHVTLSQVDRQVRVEVRQVTGDDAGEYSVTAVNERGTVQHAVTVDVIPAAAEYVHSLSVTSGHLPPPPDVAFSSQTSPFPPLSRR